MGSYIIEEFNAGRKTPLAKIYLIGIFALCLLSNVAVIAFRSIYGSNEGTFAYNIMTYATWCFFIPYYSCILIADMVFGREYPSKDNNVMLREGMSPTKVYLVKLLASILLALLFLVITLAVFLGITMIFHFSEGSTGLYEIKDFFEKMLYAVPLWLAGIGISNMFLFMFDKGGKLKPYLCYLGLTVLFERFIMLLAAEPFKLEPFRKLRTVVVTQLFSLIPYPADPARNIPLTIFLGFLYLLISTLIGIHLFNRKINKKQAGSIQT